MERKAIFNGGVSKLARPRGLRPSDSLKSQGAKTEQLAELEKLVQLCTDPECSDVLNEINRLKSTGFAGMTEPAYISLVNRLNSLITKLRSKDAVAE